MKKRDLHLTADEIGRVRVIAENSNITDIQFGQLDEEDEILSVEVLDGESFNEKLFGHICCAVDFTIGARTGDVVICAHITENTAVAVLERNERARNGEGQKILFSVAWHGTCNQYYLHCSSGRGNFVFEKDFETFAEAKAFYEEELKQVDMTKVCDLSFCPSEQEMRANEQVLDIDLVTIDEDGYRDFIIVKSSECYWLD